MRQVRLFVLLLLLFSLSSMTSPSYPLLRFVALPFLFHPIGYFATNTAFVQTPTFTHVNNGDSKQDPFFHLLVCSFIPMLSLCRSIFTCTHPLFQQPDDVKVLTEDDLPRWRNCIADKIKLISPLLQSEVDLHVQKLGNDTPTFVLVVCHLCCVGKYPQARAWIYDPNVNTCLNYGAMFKAASTGSNFVVVALNARPFRLCLQEQVSCSFIFFVLS